MHFIMLIKLPFVTCGDQINVRPIFHELFVKYNCELCNNVVINSCKTLTSQASRVIDCRGVHFDS